MRWSGRPYRQRLNSNHMLPQVTLRNLRARKYLAIKVVDRKAKQWYEMLRALDSPHVLIWNAWQVIFNPLDSPVESVDTSPDTAE